MRPHSPFRILPLHIVELILDYVGGNSRSEYNNVFVGTEEYTALLLPLLATCPEFTLPAMERMFRSYSLRLTRSSSDYSNAWAVLQTELKCMGVHTNLYPKELVINLSEQEVYSGAALKELSREPFNDCIFPKVRSISLVFSQMAEDEIDFPNIESNVSAFVERITTMAPMVKNISIAGELGHQDQTPFADDRSSRLVAQLSRLVTELDYHFDYRPVRIDQQLSGLCSLVYSSYGSNDGGKAIMELGRCNASTLRVLDIFPSAHIDIASLIRNSDGSYVQYPCLLELRLNGRPREDVPRSSVFPGAAPFPNLRGLKLKHVYSYSDDTIFRGNAATLESLYIFLSLGEARVLNECGVFTPDSHPKLQNVKVELASNDQPNFFGSGVDFIRCVPFAIHLLTQRLGPCSRF